MLFASKLTVFESDSSRAANSTPYRLGVMSEHEYEAVLIPRLIITTTNNHYSFDLIFLTAPALAKFILSHATIHTLQLLNHVLKTK